MHNGDDNRHVQVARNIVKALVERWPDRFVCPITRPSEELVLNLAAAVGSALGIPKHLAAREQRLAGHRVEAAAPARRTPAIEWHEFVGGYRAGHIQWNTARLGPEPGEPGCRASAEVLREHGN